MARVILMFAGHLDHFFFSFSSTTLFIKKVHRRATSLNTFQYICMETTKAMTS